MARWSSRRVNTTRCISRRSAIRSSSTAAGTADLLWTTDMLSISRTTVSRGVVNGAPSGDLVEAGTHGSRREQMVDQRGDVGTERRMRREQGVHPPTRRGSCPPCRCRGGRRRRHRPPRRSGAGPPGGPAAGRRRSCPAAHDSDGNVADVHDTMVGEHRRMGPRAREEVGVVAEGLERRLCLDRPPETLLEVGPDGARQTAFKHRPATRLLHRGHSHARGRGGPCISRAGTWVQGRQRTTQEMRM